jgi:hypothetical protein
VGEVSVLGRLVCFIQLRGGGGGGGGGIENF